MKTKARPITLSFHNDDSVGAAPRRVYWGSVTLFLLVVFLLLFGLNMQRGLNHDEHQFIASGRLIADGLLPYRDFPYFHAPTLSLVYALLFDWFSPLLLSARVFSILCSWLGLVILFGLALDVVAAQSTAWRLLLAASAVLMLMATPMFVYTSGRTWNHDLAMLLVLCALRLQEQNARQAYQAPVTARRHGLAGAGSGFLIGLAASVRLSFAFLALAFLVEIGWAGRIVTSAVEKQKSGWSLLAFAMGGVLGFAPALFFLWQSPAAFLFGNLEYVGLNTLYYRHHLELNESMTLVSKVHYLAVLLIEPGNLLLVLAFLSALAGSLKWTRQRAHSLRLPFLLLLLACALLSALAATPSQVQYYYLLFPLLVVSILVALADWPPNRQRQGILGFALLTLSGVLLAVMSYAPGLAQIGDPATWYPWKIHQRAQALATLVDQGKVLTLAPLYPLEGGVPIYPALATGSFAWRVAPLVDPARRSQFGLLDQAGLIQLWHSDTPRGLLVGGEADDSEAEQPLIALAQAQGYVPIEVLDKNRLWLSPLATWGNAIRLGAQTLPRTPVAPGQTVQAIFYLQNHAPLAQNLNELVRFVGVDGAELLRSDGWPWGSATTTWRQGEVWPDGHTFTIPATAQPGVYRVEVSFYDPATLNSLGDAVTVDYILVARPNEATDTQPIVAEFGQQLALRQATILTTTLKPGATLTANWVWTALNRPATDYTLFAHLVGPNGQSVAQHDQPPLNGFFPTHFWRPGYTIHDGVTLAIPATAPAGEYQMVIGFYTPATLTRLPVTRHGTTVGDSLVVATLHVVRE